MSKTAISGKGKFVSEAYYKVLNANGVAPTTGFDYSAYLPKDGKPGPWLPEISGAQISKQGYYLSKHWNMWYEDGARVYLAEFKGAVMPDIPGAQERICCGSIRLLKDITDELASSLQQDYPGCGKFNISRCNTGFRNAGKSNTGSFNDGALNTGDYNKGDFNTGNRNSGIDNAGDFNSGNCNCGDYNKGNYNSGDSNTGWRNSGDFNVGHGNSGSFNRGNRNSGKWNVGDCHCGFFNEGNAPTYMFNKPVSLPYKEIKLPKWLAKPPLRDSFESAELSELEETLKLPNFDFDIFERITGIGKSDFERRLGGRLP